MAEINLQRIGMYGARGFNSSTEGEGFNQWYSWVGASSQESIVADIREECLSGGILPRQSTKRNHRNSDLFVQKIARD
jgi:hypothetical protein